MTITIIVAVSDLATEEQEHELIAKINALLTKLEQDEDNIVFTEIDV